MVGYNTEIWLGTVWRYGWVQYHDMVASRAEIWLDPVPRYGWIQYQSESNPPPFFCNTGSVLKVHPLIFGTFIWLVRGCLESLLTILQVHLTAKINKLQSFLLWIFFFTSFFSITVIATPTIKIKIILINSPFMYPISGIWLLHQRCDALNSSQSWHTKQDATSGAVAGCLSLLSGSLLLKSTDDLAWLKQSTESTTYRYKKFLTITPWRLR